MPKLIMTRSAAVLLALLALARVSVRAADDGPPPFPAPGDLFPAVELPNVPTPPSAGGGSHGPAAPPEFDLYAPDDHNDRGPRKVQSVTAGEWGSLTANSTVRDVDASTAWEHPLSRREWQTDESWRCPVAGPLFVYGQLGGGGTQVAQQDTKMAGKTGVGCKWAPVQDAEFVVRGGPSVTYTDPLRLDRVQERSEWLLEVQARWPVLGKIGLEYQATAAPALTPLDHDWMNQDVGLAMPVCAGGKFRVGARHKWENTTDPKATPDSTQLYFGLELSR